MKRCSRVVVVFALVVLVCLPGARAFGAVLTSPGFGGGAGHQGYMIMIDPYEDSTPRVQILPPNNQGGAGYTPQLTPEKTGDVYNNQWSILNGMAYCRDYGWDDSASNLNSNQYWWIELEDHSPGLVTYSTAGTLIFANTGDRWKYPGSMVHNYYAIPPRGGTAYATYHVFVGDSSGVIDTTIPYGTVTFTFNVVPEPATLAMLVCGGLSLLAGRRRRTERRGPG